MPGELDRDFAACELAGRQECAGFQQPGSSQGRNHLTVRLSLDEGKTWPHSRLVCEGSSAYSSLAALSGGEVGLLYERDDYKQLAFRRFPIEWIKSEK